MSAEKLEEITTENYRQEASRLEDGLRRYGDPPLKGEMGSMGFLSEAIGTLYWQFGDRETRQWLERALALYRQSIDEPSIKVALLLWKMGDGVAFLRECERVLALNLQRLDEYAAGRLELPPQMLATLEGEQR